MFFGTFGTGVIEEVDSAHDRGKRVVQFVSKSVNHVSHGGKAFGLDQLLLDLLAECDVADRGYSAHDFVVASNQRTGGGAKRSPGAVAMLRREFYVPDLFDTGKHIAVEPG